MTEAWPAALATKGIDAMTFSGGVAEYLYKRETRRFGDIGFELAEELRHLLARRRDLPPVWDPGHGIRATVIGAAQFSVQISGNTILIADARHPAAAKPPGASPATSISATMSTPTRCRGNPAAPSSAPTLTRARARWRWRSPGAAIRLMRGFMRSPRASAPRCRARWRRACRSCC